MMREKAKRSTELAEYQRTAIDMWRAMRPGEREKWRQRLMNAPVMIWADSPEQAERRFQEAPDWLHELIQRERLWSLYNVKPGNQLAAFVRAGHSEIYTWLDSGFAELVERMRSRPYFLRMWKWLEYEVRKGADKTVNEYGRETPKPDELVENSQEANLLLSFSLEIQIAKKNCIEDETGIKALPFSPDS